MGLERIIKMTKIKNFTPHSITLICGHSPVVIEPEAEPARIISESKMDPEISGLPVVVRPCTSTCTVEGLPDPENGVILLASSMVAEASAATGRTDVYAPDQLVRGEGGAVVGCRGLARYSLD
jgi:hypothetical protein